MNKARLFAGALVFFAVIFSWLWVFPLVNRLSIYFRRDHYQMETFQVGDTVSVASRRGSRGRWLTGTVAGKTERLRPKLPAGFQRGTPNDLLALYPRESIIPVLYDPDAPEILVQGETWRVLHWTPDFWQEEQRLRYKYLCFVLLPVPLTLLFYRWLGKRRVHLRATG